MRARISGKIELATRVSSDQKHRLANMRPSNAILASCRATKQVRRHDSRQLAGRGLHLRKRNTARSVGVAGAGSTGPFTPSSMSGQ